MSDFMYHVEVGCPEDVARAAQSLNGLHTRITYLAGRIEDPNYVDPHFPVQVEPVTLKTFADVNHYVTYETGRIVTCYLQLQDTQYKSIKKPRSSRKSKEKVGDV